MATAIAFLLKRFITTAFGKMRHRRNVIVQHLYLHLQQTDSQRDRNRQIIKEENEV